MSPISLFVKRKCSSFDTGHNLRHFLTVIKRAISIISNYELCDYIIISCNVYLHSVLSPVKLFVCLKETLSLANEYIQRMGADMGSSNILGALSWIYKQPVHCGYPRQLFILTDATMSQAGKIIELVRKNASSARYFSYAYVLLDKYCAFDQ